jgi:hypothetical protein
VKRQIACSGNTCDRFQGDRDCESWTSSGYRNVEGVRDFDAELSGYITNHHDVTSIIADHREEYISNFHDLVVTQEQSAARSVVRQIAKTAAATRRQQVCSCSNQMESKPSEWLTMCSVFVRSLLNRPEFMCKNGFTLKLKRLRTESTSLVSGMIYKLVCRYSMGNRDPECVEYCALESWIPQLHRDVCDVVTL